MMNKTDYDKLRTKVMGLIEGLTLTDPSYFEVRKLLSYAERIHCNVRRDGSKEFSHQLEMLALALSLHGMLTKPREVYMAILTHDLLEDYPETKAYLEFNHPESVEYSSKLAKFKCANGTNPYDLYFDTIALCEICSIVKLIDRIHNLSTAVGVFTDAKLKEYLDEVDMYFVPMYQRAKATFNQRGAYEILKTMLTTESRIIGTFLSRVYPDAVSEFVKNV